MPATAPATFEHPSLDAYLLYRRGIDVSRQPTTVDTIATALGWFDAALEIDPQYAAAFAGKCTVYVRGYAGVDDPSYIRNAENACATALQLNPNLDVVHTALGDLYQSTGRLADAEIAYKRALAVDAASVDSLSGLGEVYLQQKKLEQAEASMRQAVGLHPGDWNTYNRLGAFFFRTGEFEEATAQYQFVVGLNPDNMHGYSNLGTAHMLNGDFTAAAPAFQRAIEIQPTRAAHQNLGLMQYYLGDLDAAIRSHTSAIELEPNDRLAHSNLGDALWIAGRTEEARLEFEIAESLATVALQVNPNDALIVMDLAWIRAMLGKPDDARALIDRARELAPDDPYTHYYDGLVSMRAGHRDAALDAIDIAIANGYSRPLLAADPHLAALKDEPRFTALIEAK
jgi:tetratricopeptide (TPR) repeat protein